MASITSQNRASGVTRRERKPAHIPPRKKELTPKLKGFLSASRQSNTSPSPFRRRLCLPQTIIGSSQLSSTSATWDPCASPSSEHNPTGQEEASLDRFKAFTSRRLRRTKSPHQKRPQNPSRIACSRNNTARGRQTKETPKARSDTFYNHLEAQLPVSYGSQLHAD